VKRWLATEKAPPLHELACQVLQAIRRATVFVSVWIGTPLNKLKTAIWRPKSRSEIYLSRQQRHQFGCIFDYLLKLMATHRRIIRRSKQTNKEPPYWHLARAW